MRSPLEVVVAKAASAISTWAGYCSSLSLAPSAQRRRGPARLSRRDGRGTDLVGALPHYEAKYFSQNGEDGVLGRLFDLCGVTNQVYVEIGAGSGHECNTRWWRERGWSGVMVDRDHEDLSLPLYREFVTAENAASLLAKYAVPQEFDLLSIDVDGNDYWVLRAVCEAYRPRIAVVEFNCEIPLEVSVAQPYDPRYVFRGERNTGVSLLAVKRFAERTGYTVVYASAPNAIMVLTAVLPGGQQDILTSRSWRARHGAHFADRRPDWERELRHFPWAHPEPS